MNWEAPSCVICLQDLSSSLSALNCGHVFHSDCISECISNNTKNCPLCRLKIVPSKLHPIQYNLTLVEAPEKQLGLSEDQFKDVETLQKKIKDLAIEAKQNSQKIESLDKSLAEKDLLCAVLAEDVRKQTEKARENEEKYMKFREKSNEAEADAERYKEYFKLTHKKMKELEEKVVKLESIASMVQEMEKNTNSMTWALKIRESKPLEDQASEFYSALIISASDLRKSEKALKDIKAEHFHCADEINKLKRVNAALKKENERVVKESQPSNEMKVICKQRKIEQAFPLPAQDIRNNPPKKTLSLLNRY